MNENLLIYLLSISEGVQAILVIFGGIGCFSGALLFIKGSLEEDAGAKEIALANRRSAKRLIAPGVLLCALAALIPAPGSIIKAYLMVEGRRVVTAENAEQAAKDLGAKLDRLISAVDGKAED